MQPSLKIVIPNDLRNALAVIVFKRIGSLLHLQKYKCIECIMEGFMSGSTEMVSAV